MGLTLDSIYKPLNDFFLNHFGTGSNPLVSFRFDSDTEIADSDFKSNPSDPNSGYSNIVASSYFSRVVNNLFTDNGDGSVCQTEEKIDNLYKEYILNSMPLDADPNNLFWQIKSNANKVYDNNATGANSVIMDFTCMPSLPSPLHWYDKTQTEIWTPQNFAITEQGKPPITETQPSPINNLWRLRISSDVLKKVMQINNPQILNSLRSLHNFMSTPIGALTMTDTSTLATKNSEQDVLKEQPSIIHEKIQRIPSLNFNPIVTPSHNVTPLHNFIPVDAPPQNLTTAKLTFNQRLILSHYLGKIAPRQPVTTSNINISFKYCVVKIDRPWFDFNLINNQSWYIQGFSKNDINAKQWQFTILPIAFIAVKDLIITASNWSVTDLTMSQNATDFGPFKLDPGGIMNAQLSHQGIQLVGWIFHKMPDLPPNSDPLLSQNNI